jgi:hypothetical protein
MTEELKRNIFQWFIGNYSTETQPTDFDTFVSGWNTYLQEAFETLGDDTTITNAVQITSPNGNNSTWLVLLLWNSTTNKGGFLLLDEKFEEQAIITQYSSGIDIGRYDNLYLDEEGRIYSIECRPTEERYRFVMLTNFLIKIGNEYKCDIRRTYNIPNAWTLISGRTDVKTYIKKIPSVAKYGIFVTDEPTGDAMIATLEISFENGVTWKASAIPGFLDKYLSPHITYDNDELFTFKMINLDTMVETHTPNMYQFVELTEQQDNNWFNFSSKQIVYFNTIYYPKGVDCYYLDDTHLLLPVTNSTFDKLSFIKMELVPNGNDYTGDITTLREETAYTYDAQIIFTESNGYLFCYASTMNESSLGEEFTKGYKEMVYHITNKTSSITGDDIHEHILQEETGSNLPNQWGADFFVVQNIYNLYNYISGKKFFNSTLNKNVCSIDITNEVYNENNYNGSSYKSLNSMIGKQGYLFDDNNNLIFARNLYNKTIQGNKTTYSLEIPNNMLNDINITTHKLLSETKQVMNNHQGNIVTNQYEELIINFINYITIVNENDTNNPIYNKTGAGRLNNSISGINDYDNAKMTKYRVNYIDNTSVVDNLEITSDTTSATLKVKFQVSPTTQVRNIEFISNDEQTVYNTITPELEVGKTYNIIQNVHIE